MKAKYYTDYKGNDYRVEGTSKEGYTIFKNGIMYNGVWDRKHKAESVVEIILENSRSL